MSGINLAQGAQQEAAQRKERRSKRGALSMVLVLILVLGVWGGLSWYNAALSKDIETLDEQIDSSRVGMTSADLDHVADFYFRLLAAGEEVGMGSYPTRTFDLLESGVEPGVVFTDVTFDEKTGITAGGIADDFQSVVRQLVVLKGESGISSTVLRDLSRNDAGRIDFSLSFTLAGVGGRG